MKIQSFTEDRNLPPGRDENLLQSFRLIDLPRFLC